MVFGVTSWAEENEGLIERREMYREEGVKYGDVRLLFTVGGFSVVNYGSNTILCASSDCRNVGGGG